MSKTTSRSVFIGNIPYGLTEEQITDIFSSAGKVLSFRLVYDRESGRPKGFGFAEYPDADSAASAVRNLNDHEVLGRKLRVDFSASNDNDNNNEDSGANMNNQHHHALQYNSAPVSSPAATSQNGPFQLPQGIELNDGLACTDSISRTLSTLPPAQLLDVFVQMKQLVATDQSKATDLLRQAPQLAYALFQGLLLMGLVSTEALSSVVEQATAPPPPPVVPVQPPQQQMYHQPPPMVAPGYPPNYGGQPAPQFGQMGTPPVHGMPYAPPPPQYQQTLPQQRGPPVQPPPAMDPALIQQVLNMSQELIDQLPPQDKAQFLALRASLTGSG